MTNVVVSLFAYAGAPSGPFYPQRHFANPHHTAAAANGQLLAAAAASQRHIPAWGGPGGGGITPKVVSAAMHTMRARNNMPGSATPTNLSAGALNHGRAHSYQGAGGVQGSGDSKHSSPSPIRLHSTSQPTTSPASPSRNTLNPFGLSDIQHGPPAPWMRRPPPKQYSPGQGGGRAYANSGQAAQGETGLRTSALAALPLCLPALLPA